MIRRLPFLFLASLIWLAGGLCGMATAQEPANNAAPIQVSDMPSDKAIRQRLESVLAAIDEVDDVNVAVEQGVVTLSGQVSTARSGRELMAIAGRVEGVIHVQSRLTEETDVAARVRPATRKFQEMGAAAVQMLPVILVALLVIGVFWMLGRWAGSRGAGCAASDCRSWPPIWASVLSAWSLPASGC